ncbi:hypothetical protein V2J09_003432 [Rumex salicifolius]
MGNYASCALAGAAGSKVVKVVFPAGEIRTFEEEVNAAELMLEMPKYFVVNARSLKKDRRFSALNADDNLSIGNVYVLFPMKRLNSVIGAADTGGLYLAAKKKSKSKVVPLIQFVEQEAARKRRGEDEVEELYLPELDCRWSKSRSKKPVLETILEEPTW